MICFYRAQKVLEEMAEVVLNPNLGMYTTMTKGWAKASLSDRTLECFVP